MKNKHDYQLKEYLKCKISMLYFIENYIKIPVAGGLVTMKESELWNNTRKYKDFIRMCQSDKTENIEILFSRQHGKTTTIAMVMLYYMLFYTRVPIQMLTLSKDNALDTIDRIKFMHSHLPKWLQVPFKGRGDKKTYIEFENGSTFKTKYVSGSINPDQVGRGFSSPLVWVDEAAFIPHMDIVWGAIQPAISAARIFAKKNNFPTKIFLSTTPNGAGTNWFYNMWINGWDYEEIFDFEKNKPVDNALEILNASEYKNNFTRVKIHWSETGKTEEWYRQQVKELNFNTRRINQEINLVFLGSSNTVFPDEVLAEFEPKKVVQEIDLVYGEKFKLFKELDPNKVYLLGVDTAASTAAVSDFSAMVLTDAETGEPIGEWHGKFSVVKRFAIVVKSLIRSLSDVHGLKPDNLRVVIERNSFGLGTIEEIIYDDSYDYDNFLYYGTVRNERVPGIATNKQTREQMFNLLLSKVNENPKGIPGPLLQEELRNLEQKSNGRFEASTGTHDDIIMAWNFTLFVRHELIQSGVISAPDAPSALNISSDQIKEYMNVTFSTTSPLPKKRKVSQGIPLINKMDKNTEKKLRREIIKEYGIKGISDRNISLEEEDETFNDYVIF